MTEKKETHEVYALEAIEAVARQGLKRYRLLLGAVLSVIVVGLAIFWYLPARQAEWPVAVLLPKTDEGSVQENAARQKEGFELAFKNNHVTDSNDQHVYYFNFQLKAEAAEDIVSCEEEAIKNLAEQNDVKAVIQKIKCWYNEGIRTFIITMSGAVTDIKIEFTNWANSLPSNDRPVLLATVASAPRIADRKNGVFRHYIRSKDESDTLATYIESINPSPTNVGIFHVPDDYGRRAMHLVKTRLENHGVEANVYKVPFNDTDVDMKARIVKFVATKNDVAVIIGYGPMIKNTLNGLKDSSSFNGPILVVSTFTEERWRPIQKVEDNCFWDRIRYVGPITEDEETDADRRGVVFQFSYLTLDRALKCRDSRGVEKFWDCFINAKLSPMGQLWNPHIEFTELGDSHISLRLLKVIDDKAITKACQLESPSR